MAKSRGRKFAEITSPASGVFDLTSVPTITNAKLQNSAMTLAGSSVSLGGTGVADTDALSEGSSNVYFTDARVQTFLGGGTLAGNIVVPDNRSIYLGSSSDLRIYHDTTNTQLINATGALQITSNGGVTVTGAATFSSNITGGGYIQASGNISTGGAGKLRAGASNETQLYFDGSHGHLDNSTGNFTVDVAGNINLDTDSGVIYLQDAGTVWGQINRATNDWEFYSPISDGDIVFKGNDSSSTVTALKLDMSAAGNVQARRARSNTAGEVALSVQPSDSTIHYGFRIDSSANSFNLDRVDSAAQLLTVTASGNVGIGTDSPDGKFVVSNGGAEGFEVFPGSASGQNSFQHYNRSGSAYLRNRNIASEFTFNLSGASSDAVTFKAGGNVGIGVASPGRKLHIKDGGQIKLESTSSGGWIGLDFAAGNGTYDGYMGMLDSNGRFFIDVDSNGEDLTILQNGNVGIGTSNPNALLDVGGGNVADPTIRIDSASGGDPTLIFDGSAANRSGLIKFYDNGSNVGGFIDYLHNGDKMNFGAGSAVNATMTVTDGKVGIGTTNPVAQFAVGGAGRRIEIQGTDGVIRGFDRTSSWAAIDFEASQYTFDFSGNLGLTLTKGSAGKYNGGSSPGLGGNGANLSLSGDDSQIIMANNFIHSDNSGNTEFIIRAAYGAVTSNAKLSLEGGHIDFRTGTSFSKRMEIPGAGGLGLDVPASIRTDVSISAASNHATKRWGFGAGRSASSAPYYTINESNVGVYISHGNQSWTAHSDERIKENITSVGTVLPPLMNMQCVKYNLKTDPGNTKIGFIAQDWESAFPEVVDEQSDMVLESDGSIGMASSSESTTAVKGLSYTETIPLLLKAIQEQQALIEVLQTEVAALKG